MDNPQLDLAWRYVERTGVSVFLTGKAGTGKTTFLREVAESCPKRRVIVAPTGVAAVNAGGVTIHSFFQLPFNQGERLKVKGETDDVSHLSPLTSQLSAFTFNKTKLAIIRTLELLIIDEISMVRADLLDAVDMTLRRVRRSSRPFGGVQLLMIGDVHQLPPVVKDSERVFMNRVYPSPFFFHSKALQQLPYVTIELEKVYRQQDEAFVRLLNNVRNNRMDEATLALLNSRVVEGETLDETSRLQDFETSRHQDFKNSRPLNYQPSTVNCQLSTVNCQLSTVNCQLSTVNSQLSPITLTTHNRQADAINDAHMAALTGESRSFQAEVEGNYPEGSMPVERDLTLKVEERVMFLKNDTSGGHRYYNGKLATVTGFNVVDGDEYVEVIDDDGDIINVGRETWENVRYEIGKGGEIKQVVDGTFRQYPLRPAWAVTIHKAQGLTFDRVCVNAADAFAFGQVYVALSRCRTLEGLTLSAPLSPSVAFADRDVQDFCESRPDYEQTEGAVGQFEVQYYYEQLCDMFDMSALQTDAERVLEAYGKIKELYRKKYEAMTALCNHVVELAGVSERFRRQLVGLPQEQHGERVAKGAEYYVLQLSAMQLALGALLDVEIDNQEHANALKEAGAAMKDRIGLKLACLRAVQEQGFSVEVFHKAKIAWILKDEKGGKGKGERLKVKAERLKVKGERSKVKGETDDASQLSPLNSQLSPSAEVDEEDERLIKLLVQWRKAVAKEKDVKPFMVLNQKTLLAIVEARPRTEKELLAVNGMGPTKATLYGSEILEIINS